MAELAGVPVTYIATAEDLDDEMARKIARHKASRPGNWTTTEEPILLEDAISRAEPDSVLIIDCLTLWLSNLFGARITDEEINKRSKAASSIARERQGSTVVVSNEVGSGIVPVNDVARRYREMLGRVNTQWATAAERSFLLVAGRAVELNDPQTLLKPRG